MVGDFHSVAVGAGSRHSPQILEMAFAESGLLGSLLFPADALNLFRLKEANRRFIHTTHGVD